MAQETNQSQGPMLCTTGCGFYANPRNNGMCSVCYKDFLQRQNGRGGPPESSSATGSTGESLLSQSQSSSSSSSSSIALPATIEHADTLCGQSSNISTTSTAPSEEDEGSSAAKASPDTDDVISTTAARGPEPRDESTAAACSSVGTGGSSQGTAQLESSPCLGQGSHAGKRKVEEGTSVEAEAASEGSAPAVDDGEEKPRAKRNRCFTCRKKVGLTGFDCRCGNVFCGAHRYSDVHGCTFDYRADAAAKIKKENPLVVGEKVQKI